MPLRRGAAGLPGVFYRPAVEADEPFLAALYAASRADEPGIPQLPEATRRLLLDQQHRARQAHYRALYPDAQRLIIVHDKRDIGHIVINASAVAVRVVDVAIVADRRGAGIGAAVISDVIAAARAAGKMIQLSVRSDNRARGLYERLGFRSVAENGAYLAMEWCHHPAGGETGQ